MIRTDDYPFEKITEPLIKWYRENRRDLPFRVNPTPYRVWVSEIMLQQTRVEAVKDYYLRFMNALPTVEALAACDPDELMKLWEGLGYYSRARNLQKAAKTVVEEYGGNFPSDEKALLSLAGIGDYTAGAIRSIAFGLPSPAVDGNVLRVISRLTANPTDISDPKYREYLKEKLLTAYPEEGEPCSAFTQALMELGALVCTPRSPDHENCPLKHLCRAYARGESEKYPVMPEKKAKKEQTVLVCLIRTPDGRVSIRKREKGVLKGMYEFPSEIKKSRRTLENILNEWGVSAYTVKKQAEFTHIFTHIVWKMHCYLIEAETSPFERVSYRELVDKVSLPTAFRQCVKLL